jgi:hypothetical protein
VTAEGYHAGSPEVTKLAKWRIRGEIRSGEALASLLNPDQVKKALALEKTEPLKLELGPKK